MQSFRLASMAHVAQQQFVRQNSRIVLSEIPYTSTKQAIVQNDHSLARRIYDSI